MKNGDQWLGRVVKFVTVAAACAASIGAVSQGLTTVNETKSNSAAITTLQTKISQLESSSSAVSYMTCVNFAESHRPSEVPAYCNTATRSR